MTSKTFKIGEVAELLNVTIRTIRYYEEENLLNPDRTSGGTRVYTEQHIARLRAIIYLTENDFSLEVIRLIGSSRQTCSTGDEGSEKISSIMTYLNKELDEKIGQLENLKSELTAVRKQVKKCKGCHNVPSSKGCPVCPINKNIKKISILNLIWD